MKKIQDIPEYWQHKVRTYTQEKGHGENYEILDYHMYGSEYLQRLFSTYYPYCRGVMRLYTFTLYGQLDYHKEVGFHTLFCIESEHYPGEDDHAEYLYLFDLYNFSLFTRTFDLKKKYGYVKDRRYATILGGTVTDVQWEVIKAHYDYTCLRCKRQEPDIKLTVDHILPRSKGGTSILSNIQPLCEACNNAKRDKTIDYRRKRDATWNSGES